MPRYYSPGFEPIDTVVLNVANPYWMTTVDTIVEFKLNNPAPISVIGPNNQSPIGKIFTVKDGSGNASIYNITFTPSSGTGLIDGSANKVISTNFGSFSFYYDGVNLYTVGGDGSGGGGGGGGITTQRVISSGSADSASTSDQLILWNSAATAAKAQQIPASVGSLRILKIIDFFGNSDIYPITITPVTGNINNILPSVVISTPGDSIELLDSTLGWII